MTDEELAELIGLIDAYTRATADILSAAQQQATAAYEQINMYDPEEIAAASAAAVAASGLATNATAGVAVRFMQIVGQLLGVPLLSPITAVTAGEIRFGADLNQVYQRPAKRFRIRRSEGTPADQALEETLALLSTSIETDVMLAQREAMSQVLREAPPLISGYRRVIRPELSTTGVCGLCIAASGQVYSRADLLPIHHRCKCIVLPVVEADALIAQTINNLTLAELYEAAGSTAGRELKKLRYVIQQHGELGPVLVQDGHHFTGPEILAA